MIKKLIDKTGLSTKAFAEKAGLPYTTLRSMLERGMLKSAVENVIKVCRELGITIEEMEQMEQMEQMANNNIHSIHTIPRCLSNRKQIEPTKPIVSRI